MPVSRLISDGLLAINDGYRAKNSELSSSGLPFARAGNIDGGFRFQGADRFPKATLVDVGDKVSRPGDVVFTSKGTVGRFAFVGPDTESFVYSPQLCFWRSMDHERLLPRWLYYWMQSDDFRQQYLAVSGQTDMAAYVNLRDQRRMYMRVPPPDTQRAIAHILGTLDDKIEVNRRMAETHEAIARAIFKSWFVDFDPVRAKAEGRDTGLPKDVADLFPDRFVESEIGEVPEGWDIGRLGEVADIEKGLSYKGSGISADDGAAMLTLGCFGGGGRFVETKAKRYIGQAKPKHYVNPGDIVIANTDMTQQRIVLGSPLIVPRTPHGDSWLFTHHVFALRMKPSAVDHREFLFGSLLQPRFREVAEGFATGTTVLALPRDALTEFQVLWPPQQLVSDFNRIAKPLRDRMSLSLQESATLAASRDTLLPKLISGELRVPEAMLQVEESTA